VTLTVRLDDTLQAALQRYCEATGSSKSLVVQESLAAYLLGAEQQAASRMAKKSNAAAAAMAEPSALFKLFDESGLLGAGELGGQSATNAEVRLRAMRRIRRSAP